MHKLIIASSTTLQISATLHKLLPVHPTGYAYATCACMHAHVAYDLMHAHLKGDESALLKDTPTCQVVSVYTHTSIFD